MESKLKLSWVMGCLLLATSALAVVGCGEDSKGSNGSPTDSGGASSAEGGAEGSQTAGADSGANDGGGTSGKGNGEDPERGGTSSGARPSVDPGGPEAPDPGGPAGGADGADGADGGEDSLDFEGVDLSDVSADAPSGCVGGFDRDAGTLTIEVDDGAPVVRLAVHAGVVQANGVDCESESGEPAKADEVRSLSVTAGAGAQALYLDLSDEPFSGCLAEMGRISIALGAGNDRFSLLGTNEADVIHLGTDAGQLLLDVDGDDRADVSVEGEPQIVISTGAKGDEVRADGSGLGVDPVAFAVALYGGGSGDVLVGGAAADRLFGGIGHDWFDAGAAPAGADTFDGGEGEDTLDFSARTEPLTITIGGGADDGEAGEQIDVTDGVENLYGGQGPNQITGGPNANEIYGGPQDDVIDGGDGGDWLVGGPGNDQLLGGLGDDTLWGEADDDELDGGPGDDYLTDQEGSNAIDAGLGDGDICSLAPGKTGVGCEL
jgi:Ca2+-binding RTX toxin-like protein